MKLFADFMAFFTKVTIKLVWWFSMAVLAPLFAWMFSKLGVAIGRGIQSAKHKAAVKRGEASAETTPPMLQPMEPVFYDNRYDPWRK